MSRLTQKVALVTGAGRGIGSGIALGYAREGADVVLISRNADELAAVADEIAGLGRAALVAPADVRDQAAVQRAVDQAVERFGGIDILVNAAGIPMVAPSTELPLEDWQRAIDINLSGTFICCQAVGRVMVARGRGAIVNIGSLQSFQGFPNRVAYAASKGGVVQLTRALAVEWAPHGVRVNAIAPGLILTDFSRRPNSDAGKHELAKSFPLGRVGMPADVAGACLYLASDRLSGFVTGATLDVNGGANLR